MKLPARVVGGYWPYWGNPIRLVNIPRTYNTVFLFHGTPVGGAPGSTGAIEFNRPSDSRGAGSNFGADLQAFRKDRTAIYTVGGANANVDLGSRARSTAFADSIKRIYDSVGGFDGLDWNSYEQTAPDTGEMIWISQQLKNAYGADFAITSPPAPHRQGDKDCCRAMAAAGVMDMVGPQWYDWGDGVGSAGHIGHLSGSGPNSYNAWVQIMGSADKVVLGMKHAGGYDLSMTIPDLITAVKSVKMTHPNCRGGFVWEVAADESLGWSFANQIGPLLAPTGSNPTPTPTPTGPVVTIGTARYPVVVDVARLVDALVIYTNKAAVTPTNQWGVEVSVVGGRVTAVNDRQSSGSLAGTNIPSSGVVLSGHGAALDWLLQYATRGATVTLPTGVAPTPVPPPTPTPVPASLGLPVLARSSSERVLVKSAQGLLVARGLVTAVSAVDGVFGSNTEALLKKFQTSNGLPVTGTTTDGTWRKLLGL